MNVIEECEKSYIVSYFGFDDESKILNEDLSKLLVKNKQIKCLETKLTGPNADHLNDDLPEILLVKKNGSTSDILEFFDKIFNKKMFDDQNIILYAPEADTSLIDECLKYKIFTVLVEPTTNKTLLSIIQSLHVSIKQVTKLQKEVTERSSAIGYIMAGEFEVSTPSQAYNLATMLSVTCPDPKTIALGLFELMSNSIEHGNLEIGYNLKTELLRDGRYQAEIEARLKLPKNKNKRVRILFHRNEKKINFTIADEGAGFDPEPYMIFDQKRILDPHGRGIAMTVASSFDSVIYTNKGNQVTCELIL